MRTEHSFFRIRLNGEEKTGINMIGNFDADRSEPFEVTLTVKKDDVIMFLVDCESGNTSYDGGRITATITKIE